MNRRAMNRRTMNRRAIKRQTTKRRAAITILALALLGTATTTGLVPTQAHAQDIRAAARQADADREAAAAEARLAEEQIFADRARLQAEVETLEARQSTLETDVADLTKRFTDGLELQASLEEEWSRLELNFREISGNVRVAARDLESLLQASPLSAGRPERLEGLSQLLRKGYFPDIDDISGMAALCFDEIARSGQVSRREGTIIGRNGDEPTATIFQLGKFTSFYRTDSETGFLAYAPESQQLLALSALPPRNMRRSLNRYADGESETVPIDISGGAALRQVTHRSDWREQLRAGGPIVWPILLIALTALVIVIYKFYFLNRVHGNTDRIMGKVNELAARGDWAGCDAIVARHHGKNWPVVHVIRAGLGARGETREGLESVLQEAILHELPRLQRGLALLAVFGAVAPLLGLLGTVTGMIDTFRVITLFGTSDPKLMSGGISEALVTTEVGLAVAIPIMLLHTFLSRRVDHVIGDMEENAVHLTNIIGLQKPEAQPAQSIDAKSVGEQPAGSQPAGDRHSDEEPTRA